MPESRLVIAGLVALALLGLGEASVGAARVPVALEAHGDQITVDVDGEQHLVTSPLGGGWQGVQFDSPGPLEREYQVDGSDTTSTRDRQPRVIDDLLDSPLYAVDQWLRDEASYSRWEQINVENLGPAAPAGLAADFRVTAELRRPEAAAHVWLLGTTLGDREGLELDRDQRNARWVIEQGGSITTLPRWFFPEQPWPFAAELLHLLGRSAAAAFALVLVAVALGRVMPRFIHVQRRLGTAYSDPFQAAIRDGLLGVWLLGAVAVSVIVFHQLPHILDAVSYTFQAGVFARGALWLESPADQLHFLGPFEVVSAGRWFSQYPPGAPLAYALGVPFGLSWLIAPIACLALIAATAGVARTLWGDGTGLVVLALGALSPFVLFQSGSFLSHPIAGGLLALSLAACVAGERSKRLRWFAACGALLGLAFLTREIAAVLFGLPIAARLVATQQRRGLLQVVIYGAPFVLVYLLYNDALTGSPLLPPRTLFNPTDHFGFGDGVGFHTRHTLAAGLVNTDELLTLLQFDAFGWPPLFAFALAAVPFLLGRPRGWDYVALGGVLAFVLAYVGYFYHGIALGPRYYFEAMPWLLLLCGRGAQVLAQLAGGWLGVGVVLALLWANTLGFYLPHEIERRLNFSGLPDARPMKLAFVQNSPVGPRLSGIDEPALVLTSDWWIYNTSLASLNCSAVPNCPVLFALAPQDSDVLELRVLYPGRNMFRALESGGTLTLQPLS
ncbi:MAG: hypothetical protein JOZ81_00960 [Chloroflexi bacterium]|nr:hypothetical protein [Chloroflexota bacterium]